MKETKIYMKDICDECYELRQPHTSICEKCGKETMVSMVKGISVVARCSNYGWVVVSAGGYPPACHEDKDVYALLIHRPDDKKKVVIGYN